MATYTNQGLPNGGGSSNGNFNISYDTLFSGTTGLDLALVLMSTCEDDLQLMQSWFSGVNLSLNSPINVQISSTTTGGATQSTLDTPLIGSNSISVTTTLGVNDPGGNGNQIVLLRYLLVTEITETFMEMQNQGWTYQGSPDEGSMGEGLSRFLGAQFLLANGLSIGPGGALISPSFSIANIWLNNNQRPDYVNNISISDNQPDSLTSCSLLFIYYLHTQLGFGIQAIVAAGASNLARVYQLLTGDGTDPFPYFQQLLGAVYPTPANNGGNTYGLLPGSNSDDPFPIVVQMQVNCIVKPNRLDLSAHILSFGGQNLTLNQPFLYTREQVLCLIQGVQAFPGQFCRAGNFRFFVQGGGEQAEIAVYEHEVPGPDNDQLTTYLATEPDNTTADNLLSLPECS